MPYNVYAIRSCQDLQEVPQTSTRATPARAYPPHPRAEAKHKRGHKAGRYVFRYGLHPHDHINPVESRERAEEIEMHLTNYLRRHGLGGWSN